MSSITTTASRERRRPWDPISEREELPDVPLTPREGWTTLIALLVMVLAVAVAIDDAGWAGLAAGTSESQTKFLPVAAILGVLVGVGLARSRLAPLTAHLVGAVAGAMFLLWAVAGSISGRCGRRRWRRRRASWARIASSSGSGRFNSPRS